MSDDESNPRPHWFGRIRTDFVKNVCATLDLQTKHKRHLKVIGASFWSTIVLTALTMIADNYDLLARIDAPLFHYLSEENLHGDDVTTMPAVVGISPELFADGFDGKSPLDRDGIRKLIEAISDHKPSVVAIDLDLSPDESEYQDPSVSPGGLYDAICRRSLGYDQSGSTSSCLANAEQAAATRSFDQCPIRFALIEPMCEDDAKVDKHRAEWRDWMASTLAPCVQFARAELRTVSRQVMDFDPKTPTLGVLARKLADAEGEAVGGAEVDRPPSLDNPDQEPHCRTFSRSDGPLSRYNSIYFQRYLRASKTPDGIDPFVILRPEKSEIPTTISSGSSFQNNVVFLGAVFGSADLFDVPGVDEQVHGVVVHASAYHSINARIHQNTFLAVGLDLAVGILFGWLFSMFWIPYSRARIAIDCAPSDMERNAARARKAIALIGALAVLAVALFGLMLISQTLLSLGLWLNPAPMLVGLFIATLLASWEQPKEPEFWVDKKLTSLQWPIFGYLVHVINRLTALVFIAWAIATLL